MYSTVEHITPEMAKDWLENCNDKHNRSISLQAAARYAHDMRNGRWHLTHQGLAFDEKGILIDGQHRLAAIVMYGAPVDMMVTYGVEREDGEILNIDGGKARTQSDRIIMAGHDKTFAQLIPTAKAFIMYGNNYGEIRGGMYVTDGVLARFITENYEDLLYVCNMLHMTTGRKNTKAGPVVRGTAILAAAMLSAVMCGENRNALERFASVWCDNDPTGCHIYHPKVVLDAKAKSRNLKASYDTYEWLQNVIRTFAEGKQKVRERDCYELSKEIARKYPVATAYRKFFGGASK